MAVNEKENVVFRNPREYEERVELAGTCSTNLGIEFPALVDKIDNSTERDYMAWPDRLYVIDSSGRIAFKSDPGPFGFRAQQVADVLGRLASPESLSAN
jgi:hypothetical protein